MWSIAALSAASCGRAYEESGGLLGAEPGTIELSTSFVDLGASACGSTDAPTKEITLRNRGGSALSWSANVPPGANVTVAPSSATTAPGEAVTVTFAGSPIGTEATPGTQAIGVSFTSDDPNAPAVEAVVQRSVTGGWLSIDPQPLAFGASPVGVPIDAPLTLRNVGNEPIDVVLGVPDQSQFAISSVGRVAPIEARLLPGTALDGLSVRFTPTNIGAFAAAASLAIGGATCGARPSSVTLEGEGSTSQVAVTPVSLDFGYVPCGQTGAAKSFAFASVPGGPAFKFSTLLTKASASSFAINPETGNVGAAGSATVSAAPKAIPTTGGAGANKYTDTVTVSTDAPGDKPHVVSLVMSASGAVWSVTPTSIDFGDVNTNGNGRDRSVFVTNSGNAVGTLAFSLSAAAFSIVGPTAVTLGPGQTGSILVRAKPNATGVKTAAVGVSSPSVVCAPIPTPVALRCRGT